MQRLVFYEKDINDKSTEVFESAGRFRYRTLYGVILDIQKYAMHYGEFYKTIRSIFYGDPYQLMKNAKNKFGNTASYVYIRITPIDGYG